MRKILTIFLCAVFLALPVLADNTAKSEPAKPASTISPPVSAEPGSATELKLQQQKLEFFKERLELQDKRIGDLGTFLGVAIALFGALITGIVVFFSLKSTRDAVVTAKDESHKVISDWIDREGKKRLEELLQPEIMAASNKIREEALPRLLELNMEIQTAQKHNQKANDLIEQLAGQMRENTPATSEQETKVNKAAERLRAIAPEKYIFSDWMILGYKAKQDNNLKTAADNFDKAANAARTPKGGAYALFNKGIILGQVESSDEEIATYDEIVKRYGDITDPGVREQVAMALNGKGFRQLCDAKKLWQAGDEAAAASLLSVALKEIEAALARKPYWPMALGNQGYILFLQGKTEPAKEILNKAIRLGGKKLRQEILADADIHPLPQDEAFKTLINSL